MKKKRSQYVWVKQPFKPTFDASEKAKILKQVQERIDSSKKLREKVTRLAMRGNRVYLYQQTEPFHPEGVVYIKPLIDGKYLEFPYARLTLSDTEAQKCTADWQRHNDQWMSLYEGTLMECLNSIDSDETWYA